MSFDLEGFTLHLVAHLLGPAVLSEVEGAFRLYWRSHIHRSVFIDIIFAFDKDTVSMRFGGLSSKNTYHVGEPFGVKALEDHFVVASVDVGTTPASVLAKSLARALNDVRLLERGDVVGDTNDKNVMLFYKDLAAQAPLDIWNSPCHAVADPVKDVLLLVPGHGRSSATQVEDGEIESSVECIQTKWRAARTAKAPDQPSRAQLHANPADGSPVVSKAPTVNKIPDPPSVSKQIPNKKKRALGYSKIKKKKR